MRRKRKVSNSLCGESTREHVRQIKGLLSSCKGQVEIGQHEFILLCLLLPLAVFWDFGSRKRERTVEAGVLESVTLTLA